MKYLIFFFLTFFSLLSSAHAIEYLYPVTALDDDHAILLYQKGMHHLEAFLWQRHTQRTQKLLLSAYNPAGIQLLPNKEGFSFIDNDRVRIKYFEKRSPKSLDFELPLYDITRLHWINNESFYFSACEHRRYRLYHALTDSCCVCLHGDDDYDALYPQKIGDHLYFIQRSNEGTALAVIEYPRSAKKRAQSLSIPTPYQTNCMTLCQFDQPVAFLHMVNEYEGFAIGYPATIDQTDSSIPFVVIKILYNGNEWQTRKIVDFNLPTGLLSSAGERFYESILPFLPYYTKEYLIYYKVIPYTEIIGMYSFYFKTETEQLLSDSRSIASGLIIMDNLIYHGGQLDSTQDLAMALNENGLKISLPMVPIR